MSGLSTIRRGVGYGPLSTITRGYLGGIGGQGAYTPFNRGYLGGILGGQGAYTPFTRAFLADNNSTYVLIGNAYNRAMVAESGVRTVAIPDNGNRRVVWD